MYVLNRKEYVANVLIYIILNNKVKYFSPIIAIFRGCQYLFFANLMFLKLQLPL